MLDEGQKSLTTLRNDLEKATRESTVLKGQVLKREEDMKQYEADFAESNNKCEVLQHDGFRYNKEQDRMELVLHNITLREREQLAKIQHMDEELEELKVFMREHAYKDEDLARQNKAAQSESVLLRSRVRLRPCGMVYVMLAPLYIFIYLLRPSFFLSVCISLLSCLLICLHIDIFDVSCFTSCVRLRVCLTQICMLHVTRK